MYKTLNEHYKEKFGCKVYKIAIDGGFTCPNRDGTLGERGCIFCSDFGGGEFAQRGDDIVAQLIKGKSLVENKIKTDKFIAYFQAFTNTYADYERLKKVYYEAISPDFIVGLSIATRPDCLPEKTIELLKEINKIKPVSVELGLQSSNDKTAEYIRRGYKTQVYFDSVKALKEAGIEVVTHIILGLPYEKKEDMLKTTRDVVLAGSDGVKFHTLHILKGTDLEKEWEKGGFSCLTMEEYGDILSGCISLLPKETVVHRITGDGDKKSLVAPLWTADKKRVLNYLNNILIKTL